MKKVQGAGFSVRFHRRGKFRTAESLKQDIKNGVQDNAYTALQPSIESSQIMIEVLSPAQKSEIHPDQECTAPQETLNMFTHKRRGFTIHPLQELTSPADVMATRGPMDPYVPAQTQETVRVQWERILRATPMANANTEQARPTQHKPEIRQAPPSPPEREVERNLALWLAAKNGDCYAIRLLVMDGVDLEARDSQGRTALNIATQYNHKEAVKTLLAAREMRRMATLGELPSSVFFDKFTKTVKTGTNS